MDSQSVTNQLSDLLSKKRVIAGVFTTYNFEPDFFELDVIPELLNKGIPYSTDERVKTFQVREALRESGLILDVFFDLQMFRKDAYISPQMEYLCHGVNQGQFAFHPKNIYLLIRDEDIHDNDDINSQMSLLVAAGSNNITRAGWWSNIETLHWEEVRSKSVSLAFLNRLRSDIDWLKKRQSIKSISSLESVESFLDNCKASNDAATVNYFGFAENNFYRFLRKAKGDPLGQYNNWQLEIISPYFADSPDNELHEYFFKHLGVIEITLLLPMDDQGVPLCKPDYFENITQAENIEWGRFSRASAKTLGIEADSFRRLHAKIYHFYNGVQSWVFVGSVNFSENAINNSKDRAFVRNIESGFLVKLPTRQPLLEKLDQDETFDKFNPPSDDESEDSENNNETSLPELHLTYDWKNKILKGRTSARMKFEIQIMNAENLPVIEPWSLEYSETDYPEEIEELENVLQQGALVNVVGYKLNSKSTSKETMRESFNQHRIMIQQTGWTHKKIDLPQLTAEQILAIYAGMTPEQRQMTILNAQLKHLIRLNLSVEITSVEDERTIKQFFCEYAEIFHAFGLLKKKLALALDSKDFAQVDYYLSGSGMDSLPTLIELACDEQSDSFSSVTTYLLILSAIEILKDGKFISRPLVKNFLAENQQRLSALKNSNLIQLDDNSSEQRERFFIWFEEQFRREYSNLSLPEDDQSAGQKEEGKE